jgi:hypothetical protein
MVAAKSHSESNDPSSSIDEARLERDRAVDEAMELLGAGLGASAADLTSSQLDDVRWMLGEVWAYSPKTTWPTPRVGELTIPDVELLLALAHQLRGHVRTSEEVLAEALELIDRPRPVS